MQKKTIAVKKSLHYFNEKKAILSIFTSDIDEIIHGRYVPRALMKYLWEMFWDIEILDYETKDAISETLLDMTYYCAAYDTKGCINAAKCIKEILRDCGMWNLN